MDTTGRLAVVDLAEEQERSHGCVLNFWPGLLIPAAQLVEKLGLELLRRLLHGIVKRMVTNLKFKFDHLVDV